MNAAISALDLRKSCQSFSLSPQTDMFVASRNLDEKNHSIQPLLLLLKPSSELWVSTLTHLPLSLSTFDLSPLRAFLVPVIIFPLYPLSMDRRACDVVQGASSSHTTINHLKLLPYSTPLQTCSIIHRPLSIVHFPLHIISATREILTVPLSQTLHSIPVLTLYTQRPRTTRLSHPSAAQRATTSAHARERRTLLHIPRLTASLLRACPCCPLTASTARSAHTPVVGDTELPFRAVGLRRISGDLGSWGLRIVSLPAMPILSCF